MKTRLLRILFDIDFRCRHEGLRQQMADRKVKWSSLQPGDLVAFVNTAKDKLFVMGFVNEQDSFGVLGYYRSPHGRLDPRAIRYAVEAFGGGYIDMDGGLRKMLEEHLGKKQRRKVEAAKPADIRPRVILRKQQQNTALLN